MEPRISHVGAVWQLQASWYEPGMHTTAQ